MTYTGIPPLSPIHELLKSWESMIGKPTVEAIRKWNKEVDDNGGIHPRQEHWEKRYKEVPSAPVENGVAQVTLTYVDYKGKDNV